MVDECTLKIVRTVDTFDHEHYEELASINLFAESGDDNLMKDTAIRLLAEHNIYAWRVEDKRVLINVGASAELQDIIIFLAGAGSATFISEIVKRVVAALEAVSKNILDGKHELSDGEALTQATLWRQQVKEQGALVEMRRTEAGNRAFRFSDGSEIEVDKYGQVVREQYD